MFSTELISGDTEFISYGSELIFCKIGWSQSGSFLGPNNSFKLIIIFIKAKDIP